ncbi:MAG: TonB-dependent receptor [Pseudomonadota bacterium]
MNNVPFKKRHLSLAITLAGSVFASSMVNAQEQAPANQIIEEVVTIGTRVPGRSAEDIPVPVDVLTNEALTATGETEVGRMLQKIAPSFNFSSSSISDGTDALRPATLRGLGPDQTLVLVNGKRRHTSALIHVNTSVGRGTAGVDMNAIPASSIKRIEVLRDGAAAQYGSDAIAGVINIVLKDDTDGLLDSSYGETEEGDGETYVVSLSKGFDIGDNGGVLHLNGEYRDRGRTNRAGLDGSRQYPLQADGSFDPREFTFDRNSFIIGDADSEQTALSANLSLPLSNGMNLYGFATYSDRDNTSRGFYRTADDARNPGGFRPDGFLPNINTTIEDLSFTGGIEFTLGDDWEADASIGYGSNTFEFNISNSLNASLVNATGDSPSSADAGDLENELLTLNFDVYRTTDWGSIALGAEYREDTYTLNAGEELSWQDYDNVFDDNGILIDGGAAGGIQVFPGFRPETEVDEDRDAYSLYADIEYDVSDAWLISFAGRYEDYSDFGDTLNGKLATRYIVNDLLTLRGAVSTGFRAPSMQQQFFNGISTQFDADGNPQERGTFRNDSALAQAIGIPQLQEETSTNFSAGFVLTPADAWSITVDYYYIEIDDRIVISGALTTGLDPTLDAVLNQLDISQAQFFLNAADTETQGVDVVVTYDMFLNNGATLDFSLAANFTETEITDIFAPDSLSNLDPEDIFTEQDQTILEDWQPEDRINFVTTYRQGGWLAQVSLNRFGEYTVLDGDSQTFDAKILTDVLVSYEFDNGLRIRVGGNNIFDETPDTNRIGQSRSSPDGGLVDPVTGQFVIDSPGVFQFSRRSAPFGFNGAFYYAGINYSF